MLWHSNRWPGTCIFAIITGFQVMSRGLCMLVYKNKSAFSPLKTPQLNMLTDWFSFHWQPSSTHLLLSLHFIIVGLVNFCNVIVDDFYKFQNCSQSWMHRSLLDYFCNQNSLNCRLQALGIYSLVRGFRRVSK